MAFGHDKGLGNCIWKCYLPEISVRSSLQSIHNNSGVVATSRSHPITQDNQIHQIMRRVVSNRLVHEVQTYSHKESTCFWQAAGRIWSVCGFSEWWGPCAPPPPKIPTASNTLIHRLPSLSSHWRPAVRCWRNESRFVSSYQELCFHRCWRDHQQAVTDRLRTRTNL